MITSLRVKAERYIATLIQLLALPSTHQQPLFTNLTGIKSHRHNLTYTHHLPTHTKLVLVLTYVPSLHCEGTEDRNEAQTINLAGKKAGK